ncbi:thioredoxin family protein [Sulfurihydrogenibium azorense]|uniref:thioredoxin family protein n=1 Tax=Sulfurihydrogenibium azorense TaxID=309806 RepID=UPI00391CD3E9
MKKVILALLVLIGFANAQINWVPYNQAFEKAKKENKIVFIYIYSPSCHYCDIMDFNVFESKRVEELLNKHFIPVKLRKCSNEGIEVRKKYGFVGTPMFYFLNPDGSKIKTIFGAWEEKDFVKILNYFASGSYKEMTMDEYFMKQK